MKKQNDFTPIKQAVHFIGQAGQALFGGFNSGIDTKCHTDILQGILEEGFKMIDLDHRVQSVRALIFDFHEWLLPISAQGLPAVSLEDCFR